MTKKHHLGPDDYKAIVDRSQKLPQLVRLTPNGEPMSRSITKTVKGKNLPEGTKVTVTKGGKSFEADPEAETLYVQHIKEPVWVNHKVEMVSAFWKNGNQGVIEYINRVEAIAAKSAEKEVSS